MGVTDAIWGGLLFREAQKFWFYAIATSILLSVVELWSATWIPASADRSPESKSKIEGSEEQAGSSKGPNAADSARILQQNKLRSQLVMDCCDIFIPGSFLGWTPLAPLYVGIAMSISSALAMRVLWIQQRQPVESRKTKQV
jgi:hypothetical protein